MLAPPDMMAPPAPIKYYNVTVLKKKSLGCARAMAVPPEEFGISRDARSIQDADYCYHNTEKPVWKLVECGYDPDQLKGLQGYNSHFTSSETIARDSLNQPDQGGFADSLNEATRLVRVVEHYIRLDYEDDGIARLYKVTTGGESMEILRHRDSEEDEYEDDIEEVDVMPFAAMTPVIIPHRVIGRSIADLVMDIQKIKTALLRALLDNAYLSVNPRPEVAESGMTDNTLDDLLTWRPGAPIRTRQAGSIVWQQIPNISNMVYPLMEYLDQRVEGRTGYSKAGSGLDPNVLQNTPATNANLLFNAAQARIKLIARIFAETGVRDLFLLLHQVIRKNDTMQNTVRLRGRWVPVDPRQWKTRTDMTVNVGLGTGSKDQQLIGLMSLGADMEKLIQAPQLNLVGREQVFEYEREKCKLLGYKNPDRFFMNPATFPPGQPPPDPKMQELQFKQAESQQKMQIEQAKTQADVQTTQLKNQSEQQLSAAKMQSEGQLAQARMQAEFALKREQMLGEFALEREKMAAEIELEREKIRLQATVSHNVGMANADAKLSGVRMGGEVG